MLLYDDPLRGEDLLTALARRDALPTGSAGPDLSARDWDRCGEAHFRAYQQAVAVARGR